MEHQIWCQARYTGPLLDCLGCTQVLWCLLLLPLHYLHSVIRRVSVLRNNPYPFASCKHNKNTLSASLWSGWLCSKCSGGCTTLCNVAVVSSKKRSLTSRCLHEALRHKQESFADKASIVILLRHACARGMLRMTACVTTRPTWRHMPKSA